MTDTIHHIITRSDWITVSQQDTYEPPSLSAEGFIHFSTAEQLPATSLRHYADSTDLLVMSVAVDQLPSELVWENLTGTGTYAHLYCALPLEAVLSVTPYVAGHPL